MAQKYPVPCDRCKRPFQANEMEYLGSCNWICKECNEEYERNKNRKAVRERELRELCERCEDSERVVRQLKALYDRRAGDGTIDWDAEFRKAYDSRDEATAAYNTFLEQEEIG